jgi:hypothetical protein
MKCYELFFNIEFLDENKFEDLYERFLSLGTRVTQSNKFRYLNNCLFSRFASLGTEMTHPYKFSDR